jgi:hypothetical protein
VVVGLKLGVNILRTTLRRVDSLVTLVNSSKSLDIFGLDGRVVQSLRLEPVCVHGGVHRPQTSWLEVRCRGTALDGSGTETPQTWAVTLSMSALEATGSWYAYRPRGLETNQTDIKTELLDIGAHHGVLKAQELRTIPSPFLTMFSPGFPF